MSELILTGIPVDNPVNRRYVALRGAGHMPWPLPYKNSVQMDCYECGGRVWVGPEVQLTRTAAVDAGQDPPVLCLLDAFLYAKSIGADITIMSLTDKKQGE
jgi:hypothetical protein